MNKILLLVFSITMLIGCKSETKSKENQIVETKHTLQQFDNVKEMLVFSNDYSEEYGTLKFISENKSNLHVQVSNSILEVDSESVKKEIVKRDVVYVVFQSFAQTDIEELTITAIPNNMENQEKYYDKYKKTATVTRAKAQSTLNKHLNSDDFSILYERSGTIWVPNKNFNKLMYGKLDEVFDELIK